MLRWPKIPGSSIVDTTEKDPLTAFLMNNDPRIYKHILNERCASFLVNTSRNSWQYFSNHCCHKNVTFIGE